VPYVLDASALLSGRDLILDEMFCTQEVIEEVEKKGLTPQLTSMIETKVEVRSPSEDGIAKVLEFAETTGDNERLSPTDVGVLALASDLGATVLSDDYSIQNVANEMGLIYRGLSFPEIEKRIEWGCRCSGCGKRFQEWVESCPVCGSRTKVKPKTISRISSASSDRIE
jgi:UPF0271 protein